MNDHVVKAGQLWEDNDPRVESWTNGGRRRLRVVAVGQPGPNTARVVSWYEVPDGEGGFKRMTADRPGVIKLRRFVPSTTGYRLIEEAGDVRDSAERSDPSKSS